MNTMFEIEPLKKVGEITYGMSRIDVRKILGAPLSEFKKSRQSVNTTDNYGDFHVFYDLNNLCEAVELFGGCTASSNGAILFPSSKDSFVGWVRSMDVNCEITEYDLTSVKLSIGASFEGERVACVLFAKEGYYAD